MSNCSELTLVKTFHSILSSDFLIYNNNMIQNILSNNYFTKFIAINEYSCAIQLEAKRES